MADRILDKESLVNLLGWTATQGHILTGDGILQSAAVEGVDFEESDLPHYLLRNRISRSTFKEWLAANKRSFAVTGCWSRPIFSGGWKEVRIIRIYTSNFAFIFYFLLIV